MPGYRNLSHKMTEKKRNELISFRSNSNDGDVDDSEWYTDYCSIHTLRLDFKKMENINNLWKFKNVIKLQLDNNCLKKIEGLDELTQLTWLDLSFNKIQVIEGLENLKNLEDLSLYNNLVKKLENMDCLRKLQIFSIGMNQIEDYDNLIYLRKFQNLKCLNFEKNPVENEDYKLKVVVRLPFLNFLDYRLITDEMVVEAKARYEKAIEAVESQERLENNAKESKLAKELELELFRDSFVEELCGDKAFEYSIKQATSSISKQVPDGKDVLEQLVQNLATHCRRVADEAIESHGLRQEAIQKFEKERHKFQSDFQLCTREVAKTFREAKENLFHQSSSQSTVSPSNNSTQPSFQLHKDVHELWVKMVLAEIKLGESTEDIIGHTKKELTSAVDNFKTNVENSFGLMKKSTEECNVELNSLLAKKQMTNPSVSSSIGSLQNHLTSVKMGITQRANRWLLETVHALQTRELERNRQQMTEINQTIDNLREEMDTTFAE